MSAWGMACRSTGGSEVRGADYCGDVEVYRHALAVQYAWECVGDPRGGCVRTRGLQGSSRAAAPQRADNALTSPVPRPLVVTCAAWWPLVPGNAEFVNGNYTDAIHLYTKAIEVNPHDERLYSNRSASYLKLRRFALALQDAQVA